MGNVINAEEWLQAQNGVLGIALLEPRFVSRVVTELSEADFTGNGLAIYQAMAHLFRAAKSDAAVDVVAIAHQLGDTDTARQTLAQYMEHCPPISEFERYLAMASQRAKLSRLQDLGQALATSESLDAATQTADAIASQLVDRVGLKSFSPSDLLEAFALRHSETQDLAEWSIRAISDCVRVKPGKFFIIGAEPSGGKTAFALEQMWSFSEKRRVLFVSLETDEGTLFDRLISRISGIPMDALEVGQIDAQQFSQVTELSDLICSRNFKILPGAGLSVSGIKAAAIAYRADIVIIDYLQLIRATNRKASRYEAITEISMDLHTLAQTTGLTIVALSQVTNRDPSQRNSALGIHSARESGQIEADADAMLMLDKFVEKHLKESGCNANRILRIVKNKNGRLCNIPLVFKGATQTFSRAIVPDPNWEQAVRKSNAQNQVANRDNFEQLSTETWVPF